MRRGASLCRLLLPLLPYALLARAASAESDDSCPAGAGACEGPAPAGQYYWSHQKGDVNRTGLSPYAAPKDLQKGPTWHWADPHDDVTSQSPLIDDELNIYINTRGGRVYKFSPDGVLIWTYRSRQGRIGTVPALMDGRLFANTQSGYVFALDMASGELVWEVQVANTSGTDTACLLAVDGTVIAGAEVPDAQGGNRAIIALDSAGRHRWTFRLDPFKSYNLQVSSPGDGTIVFQDSAGGVYRLKIGSGELMWQSGILDRKTFHFTTGAAVVGPNGLVYAASNDDKGGIIHAYRLGDGSPVWRRNIELMANQAVAVGSIAGSSGRLAVVAGVGENPGFPPIHGFIFLAAPTIVMCLALHMCLSACCGSLRQRWWRLCLPLPMLPMLQTLFMLLASPPHAQGLMAPLVLNSIKFSLVSVLSMQALLRCRWWCRPPCRLLRIVLLPVVGYAGFWALALAVHHLSLYCKGLPAWLWHSKELPSRLIAFDAESGRTIWTFSPPPFRRLGCAGDEELYLARWRNLQIDPVGDPVCLPDSWSQAVIDASGTVFVGFMDGHLYAVRDMDGNGVISGGEAKSVDFGNAFQGTQAIAPGVFVVLPCGGGMHVWRS